MRAAIQMLLLLVVLVTSCLQSPTQIVIMHTNDLHGQALPRNGVGGMAEIATVIRTARADFILDAGDIFTGTLISDDFQGLPMIQAMNRIGYSAGAVGNHEFDHGIEALRMRVRDAKFPMLTANLMTGIPELRKYTIINAKGIRFGIIGLTTGRLGEVAHPKKVRSVEVHDVVKMVEEDLPDVRRQSDFVIIVGHIEDSEELRLAQAFPEIRLIVGGHNHRTLGPFWLGQTMVVKTGSSGRNVGQVNLEFQGKTLSRIEGRLIPVQNVAADPEITKLIEPYATKVARKMATVVGEVSADLTREDPGVPLDNLIADAFREKGKTDIALHNRGGIRAPLQKGPITWGHIFELLPFDNTMVTLKLTGAQLKTILASGRMAVSGIRVRWDMSKPAGERLVSVTLTDGTPIHDTRLYSITTSDFLHAGGDGLTEFGKAIDVKDTATLLREVLVEYIRARRTISPVIDGRAEVLPIR